MGANIHRLYTVFRWWPACSSSIVRGFYARHTGESSPVAQEWLYRQHQSWVHHVWTKPDFNYASCLLWLGKSFIVSPSNIINSQGTDKAVKAHLRCIRTISHIDLLEEWTKLKNICMNDRQPSLSIVNQHHFLLTTTHHWPALSVLGCP